MVDWSIAGVDETTQQDQQEQTEQEPSEEVRESESAESQQAQPQPYTDEEFKQAISAGQLDTSRMTDAQKAVYEYVRRNLESHTTKKWQELAEAQRRYEQAIAETQRRSEDPMAILTEEYMRDPVGTDAMIERKIIELDKKRGTVDDDGSIPDQIARLRELKLRLNQTYQGYNQLITTAQSIKNAVYQSVLKEIPDFDNVSKELVELALANGLTQEDVALLTSPDVVVFTAKGPVFLGELSARAIKFLKNIHSKLKPQVKQPVPNKIQTVTTQPDSTGIDVFDPKLSPEERIMRWRQLKMNK